MYQLAFRHDRRSRLVTEQARVGLSGFYYLGDDKIEEAFGRGLPAELADLADIAVAVYIADRLSRRQSPSAGRYHHHWGRSFRIHLPVRQPERWREQSLGARLVEVLRFFTDDEWSFRFTKADHRRSGAQGFLFQTRPSNPVTAALFSGGLDSLAGLCQEADARRAGSFVLFSGATSVRVEAVQRGLVAELRRRLRREIHSVVVPFGFRGRTRSYDEDEPTQRSRGFVFLALGAVTALMAGADDLAVYENGVGAINLPYTAAQLGAHSTRATDPRTLAMMSEFVRVAVGRPFEFRLPFIFTTKGELCASLARFELADLASRTVSCEGFPVRVAGRPQCGLCTSCLLRRQSLLAAGLSAYDASRTYCHDIFGPLASVTADKLYPFRLMLGQAARLRRALESPHPWEAVSRLYPQLVEVAGTLVASGQPMQAVQAQLLALYRRYCEEWDHFPVRPLGWARSAAA